MKKLFKGILLGSLCGVSALALASCKEDSSEAEKITLNFGGSTSVEKIATALTAAFKEECPRFEANHNHTGSGDAYKRTQGAEKDSENKLHVGFLSRELKSSEACAAGTSGLICKDGIVAVVNPKNDAISNVTADQLKSIYSTQGSVWQTYGTSAGGAFDTSKQISRYSRDTTSGTRDGFFTTIGYEEAKTDDTKIPGASIASSNGDMLAKVGADQYAIGYVSLASLNSTVKALSYEGVQPTEAGVIDGSYKLQRNFNYCTRAESDCTEDEWLMLQCFLAYMNSKEGLSIIKSKDGILTKNVNDAKSWDEIKNSNKDFKELCSK